MRHGPWAKQFFITNRTMVRDCDTRASILGPVCTQGGSTEEKVLAGCFRGAPLLQWLARTSLQA